VFLMATYKIYATLTKEYVVEVGEAESEDDAINKLDDWISDDFEDYEITAKWDFVAVNTDCCSHDSHENYCDCCMSTCDKCKDVK
jgi:hypothetical protein